MSEAPKIVDRGAPRFAIEPADPAKSEAKRSLREVPFYRWYAALLLLGYAVIELGGLGIAPGERTQVPGSVRQSPGGYRSYHFWHSGLHGGK